MIRHEQTGLLCDVDDWSAIGEALTRLADDAELRAKMGPAAREHVRTQYDPEQNFGGLMTRLVNLADQPKRS